MAFKLRSPLHQENSKSKFVSNTMNFGDSPELRQDADIPYGGIEDLDAGGVKTNEPLVPEDKEEKSNIDKFIDENDVQEGPRDPNKFLKDRIAQSTNPAHQARLKGRIARREGRQEERLKKQTKRAEAINVRNFGNKQGLSEMEIADREAASFDKEAALIEQEAKLNRNIKPIEEQDNKGSFGMNTTFNKSPFEMKVNRAGRSKESGLLMTSPVLKTGKHSYKDAVAKMKMHNIAQTPLHQKEGKGKATGKVGTPKGEVSAVEDIYETVTRGAADAVMYPMRKAAGVPTFSMSKSWQKEKKARTPEKKSGFNPNQAG